MRAVPDAVGEYLREVRAAVNLILVRIARRDLTIRISQSLRVRSSSQLRRKYAAHVDENSRSKAAREFAHSIARASREQSFEPLRMRAALELVALRHLEFELTS